jgi:hypothetical protein
VKPLLLVLLNFILSQITVSQTFSELKGFEDQSGNTHLFYRIYQEIQHPDELQINNILYHWDLNNNTDTLFFDAFSIVPNNPLDPGYSIDIPAYDFWSLNPDKYIYSVLEITMDPIGYIYRSDLQTPTHTSLWAPHHIYISKQDTSIVIADEINVLRSSDGGFTWNEGSEFDFNAMSPFNDNILLGTKYHLLVKSIDRGSSYYTVDTANYWDRDYNSLYFDPDEQHIYGIYNWPFENRLTTSKLLVSGNNGEPYSWSLNSEWEGPVYFTYDPDGSGNIFLVNYNSVYHSTDYGSSFSLLYHFDERIVGIYKKPGTGKLYIATRYHIYESDNNTLTVLKELSADPELAKYYPLAVGDLWVYYGSVWDQSGSYGYTYVREVKSQVIKPNDEIYFELKEYVAGSSWYFTYYERIDTLNAKVYRFDEDSVQTNQEYLIDDLRAELGDSINSHRFITDAPYSMIYSADTTFYQVETKYKIYDSNFLIGYQYRLVKDFGLAFVLNTYDFGSDTRLFKGAVINGIVYGDTTITGIDDVIKPVSIFSLSQNYPNPFNPITNIKYQIPNSSFITLKVYDILGNEIATLVNEEKPAGSYTVEFNGSRLASGIYLYQLEAGNFNQTHKMIILK